MKSPALPSIAFSGLALLSPLSGTAETVPQGMVALETQRIAALVKVERSYLGEMEKLKMRHMKAGDLASANAIAAEMERCRESLVITILSAGEWRYRMMSGKIVNRSFSKGELITEEGRKLPYQVKDGTVRIDWGGGAFEEMTVNLDNPDVIGGRNHDGGSFRYFR